MKKAFTLIELLAVIIILAIVALISTPIILDVVEDARNSANKSSANMILSAARNYYAESMLDNTKKYNVENRQDIYNLIELNGEKPKDGKLYVNENGQVAMSVVIGKKCYVKNFATELKEYEKDNEACDLGYVSSDKKAPTVELTLIEGTIGNDNWYKTATYVKVKVIDEASGFANYKWCQGVSCTPNEIETTNESSKLLVDSSEAGICVQGVDMAGNVSEVKCIDPVKVDITKPEFKGIEDLKVNINDEIDLISGVEVSDVTSGIEGTFTTTPSSLTITQTGEYEVKYTVSDKAGNEQTATRKVIVSASAPTITFEAEENSINEYGWAKEDFYVTINVTDNTGRGIKEVYVCTSNESDRCEPTDIDSSIQDNKITRLITTESNNNRICVKAIDNENQSSEVICSDAYKLDKTDPVVGSINVNGSIPSEDWYKEDLIITTNEGTDSLSGHLSTTVNFESITENTEGKVVTVTTTDKAGNIVTKGYTLKLDKTEPVVEITKTTNSTKLTSTVTPTTTISGYSYKWYKDGSVISGATSSVYTPTEAGTYKLEVTTGAGKVVTSNEITINSYTITYNLNGGTGSISSQTKVEDIALTLSSTIPTKSGFIFQGWGISTSDTTVDYASGASYTGNENITLYAIWKSSAICKRATTLHTEKCSLTDSNFYCGAANYSYGETITYGSLGTKGTLKSGDAFDCDVNGDGTFDPTTERFYYVSDLYNTTSKSFDSNYAVLIYYNNTYQGVANNTSSSLVAYDSSGYNYYGPRIAKANLPTTTQWSKVSLSNTSRQILTETGTTSTSGGSLPKFSYSGYAARLLTAQELNKACGITIGSYTTGELDSCNYLMENTKYSSSSMGTYGHWLETPYASSPNGVWYVRGSHRYVINSSAHDTGNYGVRPAIEILKSNISY